MEKSKVIDTSIATSCNLNKDEVRKSFEERRYQGMNDSLLYLTASELDIMFVVCICAHFQANPKEPHLKFSMQSNTS